MPANHDSEDAAIEQSAIALLAELGWKTVNCYHETPAAFGRETAADVILPAPLRAALAALNPEASLDSLNAAFDELSRDRRALSPGPRQPGHLPVTQRRSQGHHQARRNRRPASRDPPPHRLAPPAQ